MSAHIQQAGMLSGRSVVMAATIGLHALIIGVLMTIRVVPDLLVKVTGPLQWIPVVKPVEKIPVIELNDPVAKPQRAPQFLPPDVIAGPELDERVVSAPVLPAFGATTEPGPRIDTEPGAMPGLSTELQFQVVRPSDDYYPAAALLLEERGVAVVRVCVDAMGRMDGVPRIQTSSGYRRLDAAAVTWAREALRFTPARHNGVAVPACKGFRVNFTLH